MVINRKGGVNMAICAGTCSILGLSGCVVGCIAAAGATSVATVGSVAAATAGGAIGSGGK